MGDPGSNSPHIEGFELGFLFVTGIQYGTVESAATWSDVVPAMSKEVAALVLVNLTSDLLDKGKLRWPVLRWNVGRHGR